MNATPSLSRVAASTFAARWPTWLALAVALAALLVTACAQTVVSSCCQAVTQSPSRPVAGEQASADFATRDLRKVLGSLPRCSWYLSMRLRVTATAKPYMQEMRNLGIARATVVLRKPARADGGGAPSVVAVLLYRDYDSPSAEILSSSLRRLAVTSGLEQRLANLAIKRASAFPVDLRLPGSPPANPTGQAVETEVGFVSDAWMPRNGMTSWSLQIAQLPPLAAAASRQDLLGVTQMLASTHRKAQLNEALLIAALSGFDNQAVLRVLVAAGADPNAPVRMPGGSQAVSAYAAASAAGDTCNARTLAHLGEKAGSAHRDRQ